MLITTGKVNDGVIQVATKASPDSITVTVLPHPGETCDLDATQEVALMPAIAEAGRREFVEAEEVLQ